MFSHLKSAVNKKDDDSIKQELETLKTKMDMLKKIQKVELKHAKEHAKREAEEMLKENARFFTAGLAGVEQAILTVSFVLAHQVTWYQVAWRRGADFAERYALKHTLESYLPLLLVGMCVLGFHSLWSRSRRLP